jgi:hypothetical protein
MIYSTDINRYELMIVMIVIVMIVVIKKGKFLQENKSFFVHISLFFHNIFPFFP